MTHSQEQIKTVITSRIISDNRVTPATSVCTSTTGTLCSAEPCPAALSETLPPMKHSE